MLNIHKKYKQLIAEVFEGDQNLMGALDKACSYVINYRQNTNQPCRSPELVSSQNKLKLLSQHFLSDHCLKFSCGKKGRLMKTSIGVIAVKKMDVKSD